MSRTIAPMVVIRLMDTMTPRGPKNAKSRLIATIACGALNI